MSCGSSEELFRATDFNILGQCQCGMSSNFIVRFDILPTIAQRTSLYRTCMTIPGISVQMLASGEIKQEIRRKISLKCTAW